MEYLPWVSTAGYVSSDKFRKAPSSTAAVKMMGLGLIRNLVLPGTLASQQLSFGIKNIFIFQQRE
jgi:hypothetical protein